MQLLNLNTITMTSREIAELTGKRHSDITRTITFLINESALNGVSARCVDPQNKQEYNIWHFDKNNSLILVARLEPKFMALIINRWQELENNQSKFKIPQTLSEALFLSAELAKTVESQTLQLQAQALAVAYVDNFVKCDGLIGIREAAKSLGLQQNAFVTMLIASKIMFRENGHLQSYQSNIDNKRFAVKITKDINGKARSSTMFTAKGIRWVAQELELDKLFINDV